MKLIITVEDEDQAQKIQEVLQNAEEENEIDFAFNVQKEDD